MTHDGNWRNEGWGSDEPTWPMQSQAQPPQQGFPKHGYPGYPQQGYPPAPANAPAQYPLYDPRQASQVVPYGYAQQPGMPPYGVAPIVPKSPGLALLASFFIPGLGSMINGDVGRGAGILIGSIACGVLSFLILPLFGVLGLWIWGMVDAYQGAQRWNLQRGILS